MRAAKGVPWRQVAHALRAVVSFTSDRLAAFLAFADGRRIGDAALGHCQRLRPGERFENSGMTILPYCQRDTPHLCCPLRSLLCPEARSVSILEAARQVTLCPSRFA